MSTLNRDQDEIVQRVKAIEAAETDPFGWSKQLLISYLDYEHAKPWLVEDSTPASWEEVQRTNPRADMIDYLDFACLPRSSGERSISAERSVDKIQQWIWLMGNHDLERHFIDAEYAPYGIPKLQVVTEAMKQYRTHSSLHEEQT